MPGPGFPGGPMSPFAPGGPCRPSATGLTRVSFFLHAVRTKRAPDFFSHSTIAQVGDATSTIATSHPSLPFIAGPPRPSQAIGRLTVTGSRQHVQRDACVACRRTWCNEERYGVAAAEARDGR